MTKKGMGIGGCLGLFVLLVLIVMIVRLHNHNFLSSFNALQLGMTEADVDRLFPEKWNERRRRIREGGGSVLIIDRYRFSEKEIRILRPIPDTIQDANDIPCLYAKLIVSFDSEGRVDGFVWDGEGGSAGYLSRSKRSTLPYSGFNQ
jgi:hypothetical protein